MSIAATAAAAAAQGVGNAMAADYSNANSAYYARQNMRYQRRLQREEAEWQNKNLPSFQVEGLKNAGLNPILAAGASPIQAGDVGQGGMPGAQAGMPDMAGTAKTLSETENIPATKANIQANTARTIAETDKIPTDVRNTAAQTAKAVAETENIQAQRNLIIEQVKKVAAETGKTLSDKEAQDIANQIDIESHTSKNSSNITKSIRHLLGDTNTRGKRFIDQRNSTWEQRVNRAKDWRNWKDY